MTTLRFRTMHETHTGLQRRENEDAIAIHGSGTLWAVADGMGGHQHGRFASDCVARHIGAVGLSGRNDADIDLVQRAVQAANHVIHSRAQAEKSTIGTTLAALYCNGTRATCLWVGDSRIYRYRDGVLDQITRDHTQLRHLLDTHQIRADEAKAHPMGHVLTRAVGVDPSVRLDTEGLDVRAGDVLLICSDGLMACADDDDIALILNEVGATRAAARLLDLCLERGAPDNVSIIIIACDAAAGDGNQPGA